MRYIGNVPFHAMILGLALVGFQASAAPEPAAKWVSIKAYPDFSGVRPQLQTLVDMKGHTRVTHLCVVGQKIGKLLQAQVYWPAENKLILWLPDADNPQAMVDSKRYLDLTRDAVAGDDVHTSTYLITRAEANAVIEACRTKGTTFTIERTAPPS